LYTGKKGQEIELQLGIPVECIDCSREDQPAELYREPLSSAQCIWVAGGNTFFLWHWMKESGVDEIIKKRVRSGSAVYVGQSAGSIVAGASIRTAFWKGWDDPGAAPTDWSDPASLEAMGLVDCVLFPHFSEDWASLVAQESAAADLHGRVICLTDDGEQSYICGDDE